MLKAHIDCAKQITVNPIASVTLADSILLLTPFRTIWPSLNVRQTLKYVSQPSPGVWCQLCCTELHQLVLEQSTVPPGCMMKLFSASKAPGFIVTHITRPFPNYTYSNQYALVTTSHFLSVMQWNFPYRPRNGYALRRKGSILVSGLCDEPRKCERHSTWAVW